MPRCVTNSKFLVVITSAPTHSDRRSAIRKTWCNPYASEHSQDSWQCVFLIGSVEGDIISRKVKKEMSVYRDILLGSYIDSYRNLTYKVLNAFSWSKTYCPINFVLKTDDDCFVNTKLLYQFLITYNDKTTDLYAGNIFMEDSNRPVIRNELNKWHVAEDTYSRESYPPYASGTGYILSQDVVGRVVDESVYHKPIPIEDAYTGILVNSLGIEPVQSARFMTFSSGLTLCNYLYLFVSHNVKANQQFEMHNNMMMAHSKCHNDEEVTSWF
ncbi:hypothetical protein LOTGIDRAFT_138436 [Lottia gigantea]|uniref:Hexosyltransferase n=1 Tax=Lottia gigantea TaxID=225164 RepID=V4B9Z2_LOTGI|nr:hypothetical protein LOTGIDRAFT_138436 [Lottia gigantea]ESP02442.1 hypothetical protein LOTGIDRAFT_138436 [Lottia gigantea]